MRSCLCLSIFVLAACQEPMMVQDQATTKTVREAKTSGLETATFALG